MNTTAQRLAKASPRLSRRRKILQAFIAGKPVEAIATELAMRPKQVERYLSDELKNLTVRPAAQFVSVQLSRIERMLGVLSAKIEGDELKAIPPFLRALDRAERLYEFKKRVGVEHQSAAAERTAAVDKVTRLMLTENPTLFSEKC